MFFLCRFQFLAVAQNFNCVTNNFPHFQANAEELDILFYQNLVIKAIIKLSFRKIAVLGIEYPFNYF